MSERAASSTVVLVCQGRATADGRYAVGRFSDPVARELLDPADHVVVDRVRADRVPNEAADRVRLLLRVTRAPDPLAGEPWRSLWRPDHLRSMLSDNGFDVTSDDDLLTLSEGLALPPGNNGSLRNGRVAVAVRRSPTRRP